MASKEDDDFSFGDFTFASSTATPNPPILSHPNLPPISTSKPPDQDDDEWGDFVRTPFGSTDANLKDPSPPPSQNGSANPSFEKLKGPLPLYLFGDLEDDEAGDKVSAAFLANVAQNKVSSGSPSSSNTKKSGFGEIISYLYSSNNGNNSNRSQNKEIGGEDLFSFDFGQKGSSFESKDSVFESVGFGLVLGLDGVKKSDGNGDQKGEKGDEIKGSVSRSMLNVENAVSGFDFSGWGLEHDEPSSTSSMGGQSNGVGDQKGKSGDGINGSVSRSMSNMENAVLGFNFSDWGLEHDEPSSAPSLGGQSKVVNDMFSLYSNRLVSSSTASASSTGDQSKQGKVVNDEFSFDSDRLVSSATASMSNTSEFGFDFGGWGPVSNGGSTNAGSTNAGVLKSNADVNCLTGNEEARSTKDTGLDGNEKGGDEDEDDGWEFKGAFSENKGSHGVDITLNSYYNSNGGSPNKVVSLTNKNKELYGTDNNGNNHDGNKQRQFQGIFMEENTGDTIDKVGPRTREPSNTSTYSTGFSNGSNNAVTLFAISDGLNNVIPVRSGVSIDSSDLAQDSNSVAAPINFIPDILLRREPSDGKAQLSSSDISVEDAEADDDFGDFTAAFSETGPNRETDSKVNDIWTSGTDAVRSTGLDQVNDGQHLEQNSQLGEYTPSSASGSSNKVLDLFSMSNGSTDLFSMENAIGGTSLGLQTDCDALSSNAPDILGVGPTPQDNDQESNRDGLYPHSVPQNGGNEDDFGDFAASFSEAGQEALKASNPSQSDGEESAALGKDLGTGSAAGNNKGALPLSLFGDEESKVDTNILNTYTHSHSLSQSSGQSPTSAVSINDLISNLYSQAEQSSPRNFIGATDSGAGPSIEINSEPIHDGDDSNDDSWEFKDSFDNEGAIKETIGPEVAASSITSKVRVNVYLDFYSKLQNVLYILIKCHLENIKKDGDRGKVMEVDEEIQDELKEHAQEAVVTKEDSFEGRTTMDASPHGLIEALKDPKLQILEVEYDLSTKLSSAEKDLKSALELKRHAKTMISLLNLGSLEDHLMYANLWSKMISICAQELQAGGKILEESLKTNVKNQLLSETQGKEFIKALGEIYRVAMVLGVSARLYKPWTLACSAESTHTFAFLDECRSVWSSSGLGEALLDILHLESNNGDDILPALVESIQYIDHLDVPALQDHVFNWQDSRCGLSLITLDVIPGMKTVVWDGKTYFVKLANLWANRISCDPPRVPALHEMVDLKAY